MPFWKGKCLAVILKSLLLVKQKKLYALWLLLFPLIVVSAFVYVRNNIFLPYNEAKKPLIFNKHVSELDIIKKFEFPKGSDRVSVVYAPATTFTTEFMKQFNSTQLVSHLRSMGKLTFDEVETEDNLVQLFHKLKKDRGTGSKFTGFGIIFENVNKSSSNAPKKFRYKIRSTSPQWNTDKLFPLFLKSGPMDGGDTYMKNGFLAMQMALDSVYLKMVKDPSKTNNYEELMKMMGLNSLMIWAGWLLYVVIHLIITSIILTIGFCCTFYKDKGPIISYVHWSVLYVFVFLFSVACFCFVWCLAMPFRSVLIATNVSVFVCALTLFLRYLEDISPPFFIKVILNLFPTMAMHHGFQTVAIFDSYGYSVSWSNLFSTGGAEVNFTIGTVLLFLVTSTIMYILLGLYIEAVLPGQYGVAKPLCFMFECLYRRKNEKTETLATQYDDHTNYEPPPDGLTVGLRIQNLCKVFGSALSKSNVVAVDKVNLDVYQDEITALLGHSGAGKTTTILMITGMLSPTSGSVEFKGYNIYDKIHQYRGNVGLCPQANLFFPFLSVIEHLIFFGMIKGLSCSEAKTEGRNTLRILNMRHKERNLVKELSGGMQRKLSLAIALVGKPEVIMLDEPTSGMDPKSRREIWDLLSSLRAKHTIMITTHLMEEADVLGDRVAIMDHGRVSCYGTTLFLKKFYGSGYTLTVMKHDNADAQYITSVIKEHVPDATMRKLLPGQATYNLPQEKLPRFSSLFAVLETKKSRLGIKSFGVTCTSMEEVFLTVGKSHKLEIDELGNYSKNAQTVDGALPKDPDNEGLEYERLAGWRLTLHQFLSLSQKKTKFSLRKWTVFLFFFLYFLVMIFLGLVFTTDSEKTAESVTRLELSLAAYGKTPVYINADPSAKDVSDAYKKLIHKEGSKAYETDTNIISKLLAESEANIIQYRLKTVVAAEFNKSTANGLFSSVALHAAPISLNLISNAVLQSDPATSSNRITTINHPLDFSIHLFTACEGASNEMLFIGVGWAAFITFAFLPILCWFVVFPSAERCVNLKHLQFMAGVPPPLYWLATFICDYIVWLIITIMMCIVLYLFDKHDLFSQQKELCVFVMILLLFGVSGIMYTYFLSYCCNLTAYATLTHYSVNVCILILAVLLINLPQDGIMNTINSFLLLIPYYAVMLALRGFSVIAANNRDCVHCAEKASADCMKAYLVGHDINVFGIKKYILYLGIVWILYLFIILLLDYGILKEIVNSVWALYIGKIDKKYEEDTDVRNEREKVEATRRKRDGTSSVVLTVDDFGKKFSRKFIAVQGVSFQVSAGECFGILGVNGAGKTTTFRMLATDTITTTGMASIFGFDMLKHRTQFMKQIGYCPQTDVIIDVLTAEEILKHFAVIRGIPFKHVKGQVDKWINLLGLEEYRHKRCGTYSGGNKRKLCTAIALVGDPPILFLDEPTSGVDPAARRMMWNVLINCQKTGQAIVLTSHSMEECEALCTRLTILVQGRMMCIGSLQHLKTRFGQGYMITIKLLSHPDSNRLVLQLKEAVQATFSQNCILKDEHPSFLHYHLADSSIPLSRVFSSVSHLKQSHAIFEDYTVSDTTLEQVFLAFSKMPISKFSKKQPESKSESNTKQDESESRQEQTEPEPIQKPDQTINS